MNTLRRLVPVGRARGALHNLRILTTAVLFVAFVVFAIGQWLSARWLYDGGFGEAEHRDALAQARHAQAIVQYPLNFLKRTAIDNAMWDEAYRYMQGRNFKHPDNLLAMTDSFRMMRLSAYAFAALDGKVVYARQFDSRRSGLTEPERNVRAALEPLGTIGRHIRRGETSSGYTHIGNRVFGWCSAPVLHSDGTGPTDGSWILVSELDSGFLDATSQALGSQAVLQVRPLPPARSAAPSAPLAADDVQITLLDDAFLDARFSLGTIDEDSELDLVVTIPRSVHATALRSSRYLLWSTLLFGTLLSALALWFIQWRLLRPVEAASRDLVRIGRTGDLSARLAEARQDDEIGLLVHAANHMLAQLERKRDVEAAMLSAIPDTLLRIDAAGIVLEARAPDDTLVGPYWPAEGTVFTSGYPGDAAHRLLGALQQARRTGSDQHVEYSLGEGSEHTHFYEARISMINAGEALVLLRDITERKEAERRIARMAYFDSLTALPNRAAFADRLTREIARARRTGGRFGLLFLDLDGFKQINDTMGHNSGDQVLLWTAERLREALRPSDTVSRLAVDDESTLARLGGDEFTMLVTDIDGPEDVLVVADRIGTVMRRPFTIEGRDFTLTSSIGVAVYPGDGTDVQTLLKHADTAMYQAKKLGRDNCQLYSTALTEQAMNRLELDNSLRVALAHNEFRLLYQPVIELATGRLCAVEALIRWEHPTRGVLSPLAFIALAEENGLISAIGQWVLQTTCEDLARWRAAGLQIRAAVNISPRQFARADFVESVLDTVARHGLPPGQIELEITEGAVMENFVATVAALNAFRKHGMRIALDDFGTGYSSLSYLMQIPIDTIKVDRSFVGRLQEGGRSVSIVQAILALARTLGVAVTAEGVETFAQAVALRAMACQNVQGYHFSPPVPAERIAELAALSWVITGPGDARVRPLALQR